MEKYDIAKDVCKDEKDGGDKEKHIDALIANCKKMLGEDYQHIFRLAIDSIFNPVTKVTYNVQPVPGAKEPIEILSIEVETDGSITPQDAISYSASVLMDHLRLVEAIAKPEVLEVTEQISEEVIKIRNLLNLTIDEMELSVRSHNCLQAAGIKFIYELVSKEESAMLKYKNFGRKSLTELVEKLDEMGISFGMDVDKYLKLEV